MTVLTIADLESVLRGVAQLSSATVTQLYPLIAPTRIKIEGAIRIHGQPLFWETEIDLAELKSREDIALLIEQLMKSFEKAEKQGVA